VESGDVIYVTDGEKDIKGSNILSALLSLASPLVYAVMR
jgi:hypothetical protein